MNYNNLNFSLIRNMIKIYIVKFIEGITNKILKMRKEKICIYIFKIFGINTIKINCFKKINYNRII